MIRTFMWVLLLVVFALTLFQSYWTHKEDSARNLRVERLLNDPWARPDAWTKTQDDARTLALCAALKLVSDGRKCEDGVKMVLPEVCR